VIFILKLQKLNQEKIEKLLKEKEEELKEK